MKKFFIYWLPVILWAGMIFYASSQPYEKQDLRPTISQFLDMDFISSLFSTTVFNYAGDEVSIEKLGPAQFIEFFIRKGAHFSVYFGLGFLLFRAIKLNLNKGLTFITSLVLAILYAASDEFHQSFTIHRTPHVEDVMLDSIGALVGITIALLIYRNFRRNQTYSNRGMLQ
ncbi:VanZ family protein [Fictibacillus barbaricus]|uniref:VanZ family protein n=1 Tax=Fictibacillus barbaricus TaxID=182136 RepID=A0ABU1U150_9BACL|nr:VanZ family protein [Fictibacillus barbaricus]MDR7073208.1 VanZ family protein [Fictibacillus barbaricus]